MLRGIIFIVMEMCEEGEGPVDMLLLLLFQKCLCKSNHANMNAMPCYAKRPCYASLLERLRTGMGFHCHFLS